MRGVRSYVERVVFSRLSTAVVAGAAGFEVENLRHGWEPFLDGDPVDVAVSPLFGGGQNHET
ncbi:MAG: hypothetical protein M3N57_00995 [Actinomycetota bacterium]|nr:hypothetical protein [Actinomycetota bacterium]